MGAISGSILAVCSCTILPLFGSIWRRGAGLGPAIAFLYSGPAINVLAIVLTASVLGAELGLARAVGAIGFSVLVGLLMHLLYRKEESARANGQLLIPQDDQERPLWQTASYFAALIGVLVFANWGQPQATAGLWYETWNAKWLLTSLFGVALAVLMVLWFGIRWWKLALVAVLTALSWAALTGWLLPAHGALLPGYQDGLPWHAMLPFTVAALAGSLMYFATLTEVPILQGLIGNGMGQGPALALLLAGPAVSLPNMLVIRAILGTRKTLVFVGLVVALSTVAGFVYGSLF